MEPTTEQFLNPHAQPSQSGFLKGFFCTIRRVLFQPAEFFEHLEIKKTYGEPYLFYLAVSLMMFVIGEIMGRILKAGFPGFAQNPDFLSSVMVRWVVFPILIFAGIFISTAIFHLFVMIVQGKAGFRGTFYVVSYATAAQIFAIIPFVGVFIGGIWGIVVTIVGYSRVHQISTGRAVLAYFLPVILIFVLAIAIPLMMSLFHLYPAPAASDGF